MAYQNVPVEAIICISIWALHRSSLVLLVAYFLSDLILTIVLCDFLQEFQMKMESLQQRREELERKEFQLKESLLKFDKFLKVCMKIYLLV